jgi:hypothetical protein
MSIYGHFNSQYDGNKIKFPSESFLIAGISHYQQNIVNINFDSELTLKLEPDNKYDNTAIQILFNDKCIGYVPKDTTIKTICINNIDSKLKIINIKRVSENGNYGIRVISSIYYTDELKNIGIF